MKIVCILAGLCLLAATVTSQYPQVPGATCTLRQHITCSQSSSNNLTVVNTEWDVKSCYLHFEPARDASESSVDLARVECEAPGDGMYYVVTLQAQNQSIVAPGIVQLTYSLQRGEKDVTYCASWSSKTATSWTGERVAQNIYASAVKSAGGEVAIIYKYWWPYFVLTEVTIAIPQVSVTLHNLSFDPEPVQPIIIPC